MTFAEFHNPGDTIAAKLKAIVKADSPAFPLAVYAHRELVEGKVNHVRVEALNFVRASDQMGFAPGGVPFYNHLRGTAQFMIVTQRGAQKGFEAHAYAKQRIDYLMGRPARRLAGLALGGFEVLDCVRAGDTPTEDDGTDTDRTVLAYTLEIALPGMFYPVS